MYNILNVISKWLELHSNIEIKKVHIEEILNSIHYIITFKDNTHINGHIDGKSDLEKTMINTFNIEYKKLKKREANG